VNRLQWRPAAAHEKTDFKARSDDFQLRIGGPTTVEKVAREKEA
jgi:hypothetical protein